MKREESNGIKERRMNGKCVARTTSDWLLTNVESAKSENTRKVVSKEQFERFERFEIRRLELSRSGG
jgi:hypothetical protein